MKNAPPSLLSDILRPMAARRTLAAGFKIPAELPLFVRISAIDWAARGWDIEQSVELSRRLRGLGVDLIDVSTGGNLPTARVPVAKRYQVPCSRRIRDDAGILTGAVGLITDLKEADEIITGGDADVVLVGSELLREPYRALKAEHVFEEEPDWPVQYGYAVKRRAKRASRGLCPKRAAYRLPGARDDPAPGACRAKH